MVVVESLAGREETVEEGVVAMMEGQALGEEKEEKECHQLGGLDPEVEVEMVGQNMDGLHFLKHQFSRDSCFQG